MGLQIPRKTARLKFDGDEFDGMEIVCAADLTFAEQQHLTNMREGIDDEGDLLKE